MCRLLKPISWLDVVAEATADIALAVGAPVIAAFTASGVVAARIARKRPSLPIIAITPDQLVSRQLCLLWGAVSLHSDDVHGNTDTVTGAETLAKKTQLVASRNNLIVVTGFQFGEAGKTNNLRVVQVS